MAHQVFGDLLRARWELCEGSGFLRRTQLLRDGCLAVSPTALVKVSLRIGELTVKYKDQTSPTPASCSFCFFLKVLC